MLVKHKAQPTLILIKLLWICIQTKAATFSLNDSLHYRWKIIPHQHNLSTSLANHFDIRIRCRNSQSDTFKNLRIINMRMFRMKNTKTVLVTVTVCNLVSALVFPIHRIVDIGITIGYEASLFEERLHGNKFHSHNSRLDSFDVKFETKLINIL